MPSVDDPNSSPGGSEPQTVSHPPLAPPPNPLSGDEPTRGSEPQSVSQPPPTP